MTRINLYILLLIAPAILFSLRILLIEIANLLSVSEYAKKMAWLKLLISKATGSGIKQSDK